VAEEKVKEDVRRWEYNIVFDRGRMHRVTVEEFNELGDQGWELVSAMPDPIATGQINFYFKRPKSE
jgi:hypothetical protein